MSNRYEHLAYLITGYLRQELTAEEQVDLNNWLAERPENQQFFDQLEDTQHLQQKLQAFHEVNRQRLWELIQEKLVERALVRPKSTLSRARRWLPYAAAVFVAITSAAWYFSREQPGEEAEIVNLPLTDILPGGNRATLTLADGRTIKLDEARDGIVIGSGEITYNDGNPLTEVEGNKKDHVDIPLLELSTPKGGTYQVTLSDGTTVWLNAASTLRYPPRFSDTDRIVELTGEAYFSVAKDVNRPFQVISDGQKVQVLGTAFNVSAYTDDATTKTTLVEGSVRVSVHADPASSIVMQPNQQFTLRGTDGDVQTVDVQQYTAWKDGLFYFKQTPFNEMIRQIARWYDIEVSYRGSVPRETFTGKIQRELTLTTMLDLLDISDAKIRLEGRRLIIQ